MNHFEMAEQQLLSPYIDMNGHPVNEISALTHAILALVERLDVMPVMGLMGEEDEE